MTKAELLELASKYQARADAAFEKYQETGSSRYDRERCRLEDLAEAMSMAANAREDHEALVSLRVTLSCFAAEMQTKMRKKEDVTGTVRAFTRYAADRGLCGKEDVR